MIIRIKSTIAFLMFLSVGIVSGFGFISEEDFDTVPAI
jgi:hypothetical protein